MDFNFNMKHIHIAGLLAFLSFQNVQAAEEINLRHHSPAMLSNHHPHSKTLKATSNKDSDFKVIKKDIDFNQTAHIKIQQTYQGYPVWGGNIVLHIPNTKKNTRSFTDPLSFIPTSAKMNGLMYTSLEQDLSYTPSFIFNKQHMDKARTHVINNFLVSDQTNKIVSTAEKTLVYIDHGKARWAFKFDFATKRPHQLPQRPVYIVDALTFVVLNHWDDMKYLSKTAQEDLEEVKAGGLGGNYNGMNVYDGMRGNKASLNISRDNSKQLCYMQNNEVMVKQFKLDLDNWEFLGDVLQFKCDALDPKHGNIYWNGSFDATETGGRSPANDALYAAQLVSKMYQDLYDVPVLKRISIEDYEDESDFGSHEEVPSMININVHADQYGFETNAAFDPVSYELILGDGDGEEFFPFVTLDVIAHELSHGFTHRYAGFFAQGPAAALNESFSDMAGQVAQYFENGKNTWKIGSGLFVQDGKVIRYMDNPRKDCIGIHSGGECSIDHTKYYQEGMEPHFAAGIFNKAYYLLSTSPNWNIIKAFDVMVQANMRYWLPNSDFTEAACGVLEAAKDYGYELSAIQKSFSTVGIETKQC